MLGGGIMLVTLAFLVTNALMGPPPGVTEANVRRIHEGMTLKEVETILGGPGQWDPLMTGCLQFSSHKCSWTGAEGVAWVSFISWTDSPGKVVQSGYFQPVARQTPFTCLRSWLGW